MNTSNLTSKSPVKESPKDRQSLFKVSISQVQTEIEVTQPSVDQQPNKVRKNQRW